MGDQVAPEAIGAVILSSFTGLTGLVVAWSGLRRNRTAQMREDLRACWEEQQLTRTKFLSVLAHVSRLEELLAYHGLPVPARPSTLDPGPTDSSPTAWRPRHAAV